MPDSGVATEPGSGLSLVPMDEDGPAADRADRPVTPAGSATDSGETRSQPPNPEEPWSAAEISRKAADPQALKEVDVLIAFEQFDKAKALLDELLRRDPRNPEYLLRHYHVRTAGGMDTHDDDEEMLRAMMDGPLSDTMLRVRAIGQGLMPGNPLFSDDDAREAARQLLEREGQHPAPESEPDFERTVIMRPGERE